MKKNIIFAAIVAAVTLVSCSQQDQTATLDKNSTFTASIEQEFTRTTLASTNKVNWEYNDRININGAEYVAVPNDPAIKAVFQYMKGNLPKSKPYCAIYPADLYTWNGYEFPSILEYKEGSLNTPMYAESDTEELDFKNICGVLRLSLYGSGNVRSITVSANEKICGPFDVDRSTMTAVLVAGIDSMEYFNHNNVTLYCGEDGEPLDKVAKDFFIPLPVGEYHGLTITITGTNDAQIVKIAGNTVDVHRNSIYTCNWDINLGELTLEESLAKYFKELSEDQAKLAAATDEATKANPEKDPAKFFLPEIRTWENACAAIKAIDKGLAQLPNEELSDAQKQKEGELRFFRALLYFELFRTYGYAPFVDEKYLKPRSADGVFKELINDAGIAINCLPQSYDSDASKIIVLDEGVKVTRPTSWAAKALMARAYLYASSPLFGIGTMWADVNNYCKEILNNGSFSLEPKYSDLWGENAFNNKELIFGVQFTTWNSAYNGIHPTTNLQQQFESGDTRLASTIVESDNVLNLAKPVTKIMPIIRYADILLICAEVSLKIQDTGTSLQYINEVHTRAKMSSPLSSVDQGAIENERMKELAFEGHRFWDVRRWKQGSTYFGTIEGIQRTWSDKYNFYPVPQK